jgi:glucose-6-phosphate isomerase
MSLSSSPVWHAFSEAVKLADNRQQALRMIEAAGLTVDLSTQRSSEAMQNAAAALLNFRNFDHARQQLFEGGAVNWTENRPALHTALRAPQPPAQIADLVLKERARMQNFVEQANTKNRYSNVVHLGIGGSDWGPRMAIHALSGLSSRRNIRFAANVDAHAITTALDGLDPRDTLVLVASKSFTTIESLANAQRVIDWMRASGIKKPLDQFVALTANRNAAIKFGIAEKHIFEFWDWVGGRYSLWSSIGLPVALGLGWNVFADLLAGAHEMDNHFLTAPTAENAPIQMAISGVANCSVLGFASMAMCPYDARLTDLVPWLQQLEMESLGKSVLHDGTPLEVPSSPAIWGMPGTDSQHTFFQWLHQDKQGAPVDFLICAEPDHKHAYHHRLLVANCLAQRAALWRGKSYEEALIESSQPAVAPEKAQWLAKHRVHAGGRPSTLIVLPKLDARRLGALLALYEHKVFTQAIIWGINPFDQWGVEFGKQLANQLEKQLALPDATTHTAFDASTQHWIHKLTGQKA